jgi:hypothetical protein
VEDCSTAVPQYDIRKHPGSQIIPGRHNPPRVIAQVKRAINARREISQALKIANSSGDEAEIAHLEDLYKRATLKARTVVRISGRRAFHKNV